MVARGWTRRLFIDESTFLSGTTAGDHKGSPYIHPTTLAPTESWIGKDTLFAR